MNNSPVTYLQDAYSAILVDVREHIPEIAKDCDRDLKRLLSAIESYGTYFTAVTLPDYGKIFDLALSHGRLPRVSMHHMRPHKRGSTVPRLFKGLLLRVFDSSGLLLDQPDVQSIRFLRQLYRLGKKMKLDCKPTDIWNTVNEFYQVDRECRQGSLDWEAGDTGTRDLDTLFLGEYLTRDPRVPDLFGHEPVFSPVGHEVLSHIQQVADILAATLGRFNPVEWRAKHGPGAVSDLQGVESKYDFPHWPDKLERIFPYADIGCSSYTMWLDSLDAKDASWRHEPPSKLIAVPKTLDKPRLIASEPISHQWCQQIILDFLASRIDDTFISGFIHLRDQSHNARAALRASRTGKQATIDLSSASDRLSCYLVERIFRKNPTLLAAFAASRTRWISNDIDKNSPRFHKLRKFSTMGSAITFPVQSLVFLVVSIGVVLYKRNLKPTISNIKKLKQEVLVFGDDIIVPIDSWDVVIDCLTTFGLKVNPNKTFGTGKFRESCGCDAFDGTDVTPIHLVSSDPGIRPESVASVVETHNNFYVGGYHAICEMLRRALPSEQIARKEAASGSFGLIHDYIESVPFLKRRWNSRLHREEVRCLRITSKTTRTPIRGSSMMLQYYTEASNSRYVLPDRLGRSSRPKTKVSLGWVPVEGLVLAD